MSRYNGYYHSRSPQALTGPESRLGKAWRWFRDQDYHKKFWYTILAINTGVFLAWRIKRLWPVMMKYFTSSPLHKNNSSLLLSTFSHMTLWHFGLNMLVMWSFITPFVSIVSPLLSWPFFLTAGTWASAVGVSVRKIMQKNLSIPSLGASGALLAMITLLILNHPDASVYIVFFPFVPIPGPLALGGVVALDVVGLLRGWQAFDHGAHIAGVVFGVLYYKWLHEALWRNIAFVRNLWIAFRKNFPWAF